jgi:hypothetical protein
MVSRSHAVHTNKNSRKTSRRDSGDIDPVEQGKRMTHDMIEYITDYARENPGTAALCCMGVGFVLGWKLKPW